MSTITLNQNVAECLRSTSHIGGTTVRNICTGAEAYVPWGSLDWLGVIGACAFVVAAISVFAALAFVMIRESL